MPKKQKLDKTTGISENMKQISKSAAVLQTLLFICGCLSYQYDGKKAAEPTEKVQLYTDSARIRQTYTVLGRATVSGNYQEVSSEKMTAKLIEEAKKCGANAILITGQQILPISEVNRSGNRNEEFMTAFDYDDTSQSWSQLYQDVNLRYGNIRNSSTAPAAASPKNYKRVMRAEFLQFTAGTGTSGADSKTK